jgi:mannose-6-phosphate isomerase-like protein (cupin superfamily)
MKFSPLTIIDLSQEATTGTGDYTNFVLSNVNNHVIRMSIMTEPYFWHFHPNSDETFLIVIGAIFIDLEAHPSEFPIADRDIRRPIAGFVTRLKHHF